MKIAITQLGRIGDMILLAPLFKALKEKYPECLIDVICSRHNFSVIKRNPRVAGKIIYSKSPIKLAGFIKALRTEKYDYYIDPKGHHSSESAIIARLARAEKKIGFKGAKDVFDISITSDEKNAGRHFIWRALKAAEPLGIAAPSGLPRPELFLSDDSLEYAAGFAGPAEKIIAVNISASRADKMRPPEKWIDFINSISLKNARLILTYAPAEAAQAKDILDSCPGLIDYKPYSLEAALALVKMSSLLITVDTALVHAASAFDTPLIALYNYNREFFKKFAPLSRHQYLIRSEKGRSIQDIENGPLFEIFEKAKSDLELS